MSLRSAALVVLVAMAGCGVEVDDGMTFGVPDPPSPGSSGGAGGDDGSDSGVGDSAADDGTGGDDTGGIGDSGQTDSDGADDAGDTGEGGDDGGTTGGADPTTAGGETSGTGGTGGAPGAGPWEDCLNGMECGAGMGCLNNGPTPTDGVCTTECVGFLDTSGCASPPPGGDALLTCIALGGQNICALDCAGGKACPTGMQCMTEQDDYGSIEICM